MDGNETYKIHRGLLSEAWELLSMQISTLNMNSFEISRNLTPANNLLANRLQVVFGVTVAVMAAFNIIAAAVMFLNRM